MARCPSMAWKSKQLCVGTDQHRKRWHGTVRSAEGLV